VFAREVAIRRVPPKSGSPDQGQTAVNSSVEHVDGRRGPGILVLESLKADQGARSTGPGPEGRATRFWSLSLGMTGLRKRFQGADPPEIEPLPDPVVKY